MPYRRRFRPYAFVARTDSFETETWSRVEAIAASETAPSTGCKALLNDALQCLAQASHALNYYRDAAVINEEHRAPIDHAQRAYDEMCAESLASQTLWAKLLGKISNERLLVHLKHLQSVQAERDKQLLALGAPPSITEAEALKKHAVAESAANILREAIAHAEGKRFQKRLSSSEKAARAIEQERLRTQKLQDALVRASLRKEELQRLRAVSAKVAGKSRERAAEIRASLLKTQPIGTNCPYCNGTLGIAAHLDHIIPLARGGLSVAENLVFVCDACNHTKADQTLASFIKQKGLPRDEIESRLDRLGKIY